MHWEARCLSLRTKNGGLKNSGGTLPTHLVAPKKWTCHMVGKITKEYYINLKSYAGKSLKRGRAAQRHTLNFTLRPCPLQCSSNAHVWTPTFVIFFWSRVAMKRQGVTQVVALTTLVIGSLENQNREGYNADWKEQYIWLVPVADCDKPEEIIGLLCGLCQRHNLTQRSGAGTWVSEPCTVLR